jgi:hypothetical protein
VGIYSLEADTLKLCLRDGEVPPIEFVAKPDERSGLMVLKRESAEARKKAP